MKFIKLITISNWGFSYFYPEGKGLTPAGTCDTESGFKLKTGQEVRVRWPDGTIEKVGITMKPVNRRISDMEYTCDVNDSRPVFTAELHGRTITLDLVGMDVCEEDLS